MHTWLRKLYWDESEVTRGAFKSTTYFDHVRFFHIWGASKTGYFSLQIKRGYTAAAKLKVIPAGPDVNILPLDAN